VFEICFDPNSADRVTQIGVLAVYHGELHMAQTVMIGSILSDVLLVS
jgi:hypothetical protein